MSRQQPSPNADFICKHCRAYVTAEVLLAGVRNRNHCPYCLWSRHLDLYQAGDRLSACKGAMQPVGLTRKLTFKRYVCAGQGELMLVHHCSECGEISINRIAADDDAEALLALYQVSLESTLAERLARQGIHLLDREDAYAVRTQLFGWQETLKQQNV